MERKNHRAREEGRGGRGRGVTLRQRLLGAWGPCRLRLVTSHPSICLSTLSGPFLGCCAQDTPFSWPPFPDGLTVWLSCPPAASRGCCNSVVKEERTVKSIKTAVRKRVCNQGRPWSQISVQILAPSSTSRATANKSLTPSLSFSPIKRGYFQKNCWFCYV